MQPSVEALKEFKRLYDLEFGVSISDNEAYERFARLVNVLRIVCFPGENRPLDNSERYDMVPRNSA